MDIQDGPFAGVALHSLFFLKHVEVAFSKLHFD